MPFGIEKRYSDYDELLKDPQVDAVHINSPIPNHAEQSLKALYAGKHVACTVPMATSVEDCMKIVKACKETGKKYMMMETVVYAREFLFVKEMYEKGELGKVQFLKASHQQDMDGWPDYWPGLPPMHLCNPLCWPGCRLVEVGGGVCFLLRFRNHPGRTCTDSQLTFCSGIGTYQVQKFRPQCLCVQVTF